MQQPFSITSPSSNVITCWQSIHDEEGGGMWPAEEVPHQHTGPGSTILYTEFHNSTRNGSVRTVDTSCNHLSWYQHHFQQQYSALLSSSKVLILRWIHISYQQCYKIKYQYPNFNILLKSMLCTELAVDVGRYLLSNIGHWNYYKLTNRRQCNTVMIPSIFPLF